MPRKKKSSKGKSEEAARSDKKEEKAPETSNDSKIIEARKLLEELNIHGEVIKEENKVKIIVGSLPDAFRLYRHGFYNVEVDESKSLIKRKK